MGKVGWCFRPLDRKMATLIWNCMMGSPAADFRRAGHIKKRQHNNRPVLWRNRLILQKYRNGGQIRRQEVGFGIDQRAGPKRIRRGLRE
jgi:hypothetical protein